MIRRHRNHLRTAASQCCLCAKGRKVFLPRSTWFALLAVLAAVMATCACGPHRPVGRPINVNGTVALVDKETSITAIRHDTPSAVEPGDIAVITRNGRFVARVRVWRVNRLGSVANMIERQKRIQVGDRAKFFRPTEHATKTDF